MNKKNELKIKSSSRRRNTTNQFTVSCVLSNESAAEKVDK